jgi:hypothetical protein
MKIELELTKMSVEQLKQLKEFAPKEVEAELKARDTYSDEDMRNFKVYTDLSKAYFFLKPMYDNMRNCETKRILAESEVLDTLEKIFRFCELRQIKYTKYAPVAEPIVGPAPEPVAEPVVEEPVVEEPVAEPVVEAVPAGEPVFETVIEPAPEPVAEPVVEEPVVEEPVVEAVPEPVAEPASEPADSQMSATERMSLDQLNAILSAIPVVK